MKDCKYKYMVFFLFGILMFIKMKSFLYKEILYIYVFKIFFLNVRYRFFIMFEYNFRKEVVFKYLKVNVGSLVNEKLSLFKM